MNFKAIFHIGLVVVVVSALALVTSVVRSDEVFFAADRPEPYQVPLYMRDSVPPLNMLVMGKDHKIYYEAYNDASDLDGDGVVDVGYRGWELKNPAPIDESSPYKIDYYGYFDSFLCYSWNGSEFVPQGSRTTDKTCSGQWSGDFLNYATMSRMDALRRVLYGGFRAVDTEDRTVLQGAFFPQDAHSWGKEYHSVERDGYNIGDYTPLPLPDSGRYHLFAVTTRSGNLASYPAYQAPMFRVLRNTTARVWNWVAMEGPVAGDHCFAQGTPCAGGGAHPGHPDNRAEFDSMEAAWAHPAYLLGSGNPSTINCDSNCGDSGQHDNYLTVIEGQFYVSNPENFQFAVDGDDAVDFQILDGNTVLAERGYYGAHGRCNCNSHSTGEIRLTSGTYTIRFRHEEAGSGDNYQLRMRSRASSNSNWGSWGVAPVQSGSNSGLQNLTRSTYTIISGGASFDPDRYVRVETCSSDPDHRDATCKTYPEGNHKPTGILHDYGEDQRMYFGLITGSQANNLQGGVLRRNIENFADEVDASTGVFTDVEGIARSIDRLRMIGGAYNGGGDNLTSQKNWNWANSEGALGGHCESQGHRMIANGECRMWGNPIAEMMFEAVRYFAGAGAPTSAFSSGGSSEGRAEDNRLGLATPEWVDPYRAGTGGGGYASCSRPVMTVISDINPSYDGDLPGSAFESVSADPALPGFNASELGGAIWDKEFGPGSRSVFIGETPDINDGAPTAKLASSFGNIRGLAPEEPTKGGTYYSASVAAYGAANRLNARADYPYLTTFAVALASPLPRMEIPVGERTVELLPFAMTVSGTFGEHERKPVNTIVDFFVQEMVNFPGGESDDNVNGGRPYAVFRINYEDVEQGNDHDMDAIVRYTITANADNTLTVQLDSEYAAGSANQNMGYVISGTTADGVYLEVRDTDSNQNTSVYELNTPPGVGAGGCIGNTGSSPCNAGLTLNAERTFTAGDAGLGERLNDPLWYAAKYGTPADITPNPDVDGDGEPRNYFLVTNPLNMRAQLATAFDRAAALDLDVGSASVSGARVGSASFTLQPSFARERNGKDWQGGLSAVAINSDATLGSVLWEAEAGIPGYTSRNIFTIHAPGAGTHATLSASRFSYDSLPGSDDDILRLLGINPVQVASRYGGNYSAEDFVNYLAGHAGKEEGQGGTLRARGSTLGSIINSEPVIASPRSDYGYGMYADSMFDGYSTFLEQKRTADRTYVYVGANDGMLHAFDAATEPCSDDLSVACAGPDAGDEVFAFIPNSALGALGELALPDDLYGHRYYVDGQIAVSDAKTGSQWRTLLAGATGGGGRSIFVLDVTDPDSFSSGDVLWERNGAVDNDMGYTYGKPLIVPLEDGSWGVLFGNGYGGNTSDPSLYILDAFTGQVIRKLTADDGHSAATSGGFADLICSALDFLPCARNTDPFNGLGQITAIDSNGNGRVDTVYGGDLQGNLWKFDLGSDAPSSWGVDFDGEPLFTASRDGVRQPITGGIRVAAGPGTGVMVFFGTGRYLYAPDNTVEDNPDIQSLYGIFDDNEDAVSGGRVSLAQQFVTGETTASGQTVRGISRSAVSYFGASAKRGWFIDLAVNAGTGDVPDLDARGERFIATPLIQSGRVFFPTYTPLEDSCNPGGLNFVYGLDLLSGSGALSDVSVLSSDDPVCTGGNCGAVAIDGGNGDDGDGLGPDASPPVTGTSALAINPISPVDPSCTGPGCATFEQCQVVIYPGAFVLPRPCGRQSWRQLR